MNPLEKAWVLLKEDEYSDEEYAQARARMKEIEEELTQQFAGGDMNPSEEIQREWDILRPILQSRPPPKDPAPLYPPSESLFDPEDQSPTSIDLGSAGIEDAKEQHKQRMREEKRMRRGE
jgi:hypothetical protein